jgi:hypothetical protein
VTTCGETLRDRLKDLPLNIRNIAWKAQVRLCARFSSAKGKKTPVATTAIARDDPRTHVARGAVLAPAIFLSCHAIRSRRCRFGVSPSSASVISPRHEVQLSFRFTSALFQVGLIRCLRPTLKGSGRACRPSGGSAKRSFIGAAD